MTRIGAWPSDSEGVGDSDTAATRAGGAAP